MVELYSLAPTIRIFFCGLLVIAVALQTLRLLLLVSHQEYKIPWSVIFHEISMLAHLILAAMLLAIPLIQRNIAAGYLYEYRLIDVVPMILGAWLLLKHKKKEPMVCAVLLLPTLPFYTFAYSQYFFLFSNLYFVFRSVVLLDLEWNRITGSITRLSVKEAVDMFPGGILYADGKGRTLIINPALKRLLYALDIQPEMDAGFLWESLMQLQDSYDVSVRALDDKLLIRIRNAGTWIFSNEAIIIKNKRYMLILAIDITDEDILTREMEESNKTLEELGDKLSAAIKNIEQLELEREILRMKTRVHDVLGQRLSILSRLLESDMDPEDIINKFRPLLMDMTQAITETVAASPHYLLSSLPKSFILIGTVIHIKGTLPKDHKTAAVFAEIIRECATNAVRHADAENVYVEFQENEEEYRLTVLNDGTAPNQPIVEGGGIPGMRRQVHELGGTLEIRLKPQFELFIRIPGNREEDVYD